MSSQAVAVVIPAHNEVGTVAKTIRSVRWSLEAAEVTASCIVVVADACSDGTEVVAGEHLRPDDRLVVIDRRCVGAGRAMGSRAAAGRLGVSLEDLWIMNIDADSTAPLDWVRRHLWHSDHGAECVAGIVDLDDRAPLRLRHRFAARYGADITDVGHTHVHGANLGIRADTLAAVGNWPEVETGEDQTLWARVQRLGRPVVSDPRSVVHTSARLSGRAPSGFAADLESIIEGGASS